MIQKPTNIKEFYNALLLGKQIHGMRVCHSSVQYVLSALTSDTQEVVEKIPQSVKERAVELTAEELEQILYDEGLLPAAEYGIPNWFAAKWLNKKKQKGNQK